MTLANYAMKLEREVWGVLEGPWGGDTWMGFRRDWAQKVSTPSKPFILSNLCHCAPLSNWNKSAVILPAGCLSLLQKHAA